MYSVTRLLDVEAAARNRVIEALQVAAAAVPRWIVQPTLSGSRNGGDILVHLRFDTEDQWRSLQEDFETAIADPAISHVNGAAYSGTMTCAGGARGTVYRALLLRVLPETDEETIARFERELRSMPTYVRTITAWQLSRVEDAVGTSPWTHVFEQEFTDVAGLMGPYLMHPMHWAVVDRWFDPECPDVIVRDRVCHSFCALPPPASRRKIP